jgi:hypothetical protein
LLLVDGFEFCRRQNAVHALRHVYDKNVVATTCLRQKCRSYDILRQPTTIYDNLRQSTTTYGNLRQPTTIYDIFGSSTTFQIDATAIKYVFFILLTIVMVFTTQIILIPANDLSDRTSLHSINYAKTGYMLLFVILSYTTAFYGVFLRPTRNGGSATTTNREML